MKGAMVRSDAGPRKAIVELMVRLMDKGSIDAVLVPMKVRNNGSFAYVLAQDKDLLKEAVVLPPVMTVQGAKAISRLTRLEKGNMRIAAIMRPCEIRAAVELAKLEQADLENLVLVSLDCPGALPLSDLNADPKRMAATYEEVVKGGGEAGIREVCKMCDSSSMVAGDLHVGTLGAKDGTFYLIPNGKKGEDMLAALGLSADGDLADWKAKVEDLSARRGQEKEKVLGEMKARFTGLDGILDAFSQCINCHNCMRACPICYCQVCYFESEAMNHPADDYMQRGRVSGSLRFPADTILFQVGRMLHMGLSCVSCGACEDACPVGIPVARLFSMGSHETQALFEYVPGKEKEGTVPLITYKENELKEMGE